MLPPWLADPAFLVLLAGEDSAPEPAPDPVTEDEAGDGGGTQDAAEAG